VVADLAALDPAAPGEGGLPSTADRAAVPELAERFLAADAAAQELFVALGPEFRTWAFAEWLAYESERAAAGSPPEALRLSRLALRVAELAASEETGPWGPRLLGFVWTYVANAERANQNLKSAEAASREGRVFWKRGAKADPAGLLPEWRVLDLEASLRRDQRRFAEALDLHGRALDLAPKAEAGRLLLKKAATFEQKSDFRQALATLDTAAPWISAASEPRHRFGLSLGRAFCLCHLGRAAEAESLLPEVRSLAVRLDNASDFLRVRWLEGRVAAGLGRVEEAVVAYSEVRGEFESRGMPYDCALASLDVALLYREERRWPEIRRLAAEVVRIFAKGKIHREVHAAMVLFQEAAVKEAVTVALLRRLQEYLQQARVAPGLRFVAVAGRRQKAQAAE
jgi:tetratricopeptide (TPR) repeat protein